MKSIVDTTCVFHCHSHLVVSSRLTCTLGPADERRPRRPRAPLARPGEQHADAVLRVRLQMPHLVGERAHAVSLSQHGVAGAVLDFPPDDRSVPDDGVGVELDDEVRGARPHQLRRRDRSRGNCGANRKWKEETFGPQSQRRRRLPGQRPVSRFLH